MKNEHFVPKMYISIYQLIHLWQSIRKLCQCFFFLFFFFLLNVIFSDAMLSKKWIFTFCWLPWLFLKIFRKQVYFLKMDKKREKNDFIQTLSEIVWNVGKKSGYGLLKSLLLKKIYHIKIWKLNEKIGSIIFPSNFKNGKWFDH